MENLNEMVMIHFDCYYLYSQISMIMIKMITTFIIILIYLFIRIEIDCQLFVFMIGYEMDI